MDRILKRYRSILARTSSADDGAARRYAGSLSPTGTWPDIDYADQNRAAWQPASHLARVQAMARYLATTREDSDGTRAMRQAIDSALDHWLAKRYQATNWWWNQIGMPRAMRDIVILLGDRLDERRRQGAIEVIGQHQVKGTGANLAWSAELSLHHGCLTGTARQVAEAAQRIWDEVAVGRPEGIQRDWSFFQHGPRLQAFHYGRAYLAVVVQVAWQARETPWRMPADKRDVISSYILDGLQWMCRGTYTSPGTMDRSAIRQHALNGADLRQTLLLWREVHPQRSRELDLFAARQRGEAQPLCGLHHFPDADFTAYHRPGGTILLKTISSRTLPTESINGENLLGVPYLHCGDHYVLRNGREYLDLPPVWDWRRLPGLTLPAIDSTQQRRDFVGGLGDGRSGLAAMDYAREGEKGSVRVRRMWAFHEDLAVCLLGGWECDGSAGEVTTAIEQCRLQDQVRVCVDGSGVQTLPMGEHRYRHLRWVLHNGIGYIPLEGAHVSIRLEEATGSWARISSGYGEEPVSEPVLRIQMDHGTQPQATGFILVLGASRAQLERLTSKPVCQVLRNDADTQCVRFDGNLTMVAFHAPLEGSDLGIAVDRPCLAMWSSEDLWLCDPTHKGGDLAVTWQGHARRVSLPEAGRAVQVRPDP